MDFVVTKSTKQNTEDHVSVYARVRNTSYNKKYAVGFCLKKSEWETYKSGKYKADTVISSLGIKYGVFANTLEQIRQELEESFNPETAPQIIKTLKKAITEGYQPILKKRIYYSSPLLTEFLQKCHDEYACGARTKRGSSAILRKGSLRHFITAKNNILRFEKENDCIVKLDDVNMEFQNKYITWNTSYGIKPSTLKGYLYSVHTVMGIALREHITRNEAFLNHDFIPADVPVDQVYLSPEQITTMYNLDISSKDKIRELLETAVFETESRRQEIIDSLTDRTAVNIMNSKDIFLVGCMTGQRLSDFRRINKSMRTKVNGKVFFKLVQVKTNKTVYIPEDYRVKEILKRHHGVLPHIPDATLNRCIKLIAELLGWTYMPKIEEGRMGRKFGPRFCDMISSHTARRSFATNAYAAGVPLSSIMAITGHSREEKLRTYLHLQEEEKGVIAASDLKGVLEL